MAKAHYLANKAPLFSQLKVVYHHNLLPSGFRHLFLSSNQVRHYETRLASHYRPHFVGLILGSSVSFIENQCQFH